VSVKWLRSVTVAVPVALPSEDRGEDSDGQLGEELLVAGPAGVGEGGDVVVDEHPGDVGPRWAASRRQERSWRVIPSMRPSASSEMRQ
jgi:hypothetical protein